MGDIPPIGHIRDIYVLYQGATQDVEEECEDYVCVLSVLFLYHKYQRFLATAFTVFNT